MALLWPSVSHTVTDESPASRTIDHASITRSRPSRKNLYEALLPVSDDWKSLGVLLDCDYPTLQDFEKRKQKDRTCLLEMVDLLLRKIDMSWELVVEAVKKLGHEYQAQVIMQQFVSS